MIDIRFVEEAPVEEGNPFAGKAFAQLIDRRGKIRATARQPIVNHVW
ncbi:hypothetical protein HPL003_16100 [Paenibacillus terrae HPL-003]|uniref:Uncharacterized protein n=1 Tax=Paenibacillus terrae (strain HPL-003) TaxID=985665 RepID=G7W0N1_PAETH|nr:hypothetical protein HPL003_16100 [Paenibacillus terrae HPL-003]